MFSFVYIVVATLCKWSVERRKMTLRRHIQVICFFLRLLRILLVARLLNDSNCTFFGQTFCFGEHPLCNLFGSLVHLSFQKDIYVYYHIKILKKKLFNICTYNYICIYFASFLRNRSCLQIILTLIANIKVINIISDTRILCK